MSCARGARGRRPYHNPSIKQGSAELAATGAPGRGPPPRAPRARALPAARPNTAGPVKLQARHAAPRRARAGPAHRTVRAFSMVSAVVNVLETTTTSVVSWRRPLSARATSTGSTLARKRSWRPLACAQRPGRSARGGLAARTAQRAAARGPPATARGPPARRAAPGGAKAEHAPALKQPLDCRPCRSLRRDAVTPREGCTMPRPCDPALHSGGSRRPGGCSRGCGAHDAVARSGQAAGRRACARPGPAGGRACSAEPRSVRSAVCTNSGPRNEPPMPIATTSVSVSPVAPFHSPERTCPGRRGAGSRRAQLPGLAHSSPLSRWHRAQRAVTACRQCRVLKPGHIRTTCLPDVSA